MAFLTQAANRGSISTGYDIDNSLKFEADNSEYIYRTPSSSGNRKTWTLSFWIKRTELADGSNTMRVFEAWDGSTGTSGLFTAADAFILDLNAGSNYFTSNAKFRDCSAWYHFVIRVDTTQGTASERARVYVNGLELTGSWNSNIGQNTDLTWNQNVAHNFARFHNNDSFVSGYYSEIINVDGQSLAPTSFGEFDEDSGIWKPKNANGGGTNGFKLEFKSSGSLGADTSGNGHTWSLNAIAAADQATDTPTNNFCTLNPLWTTNPSYVGIIRNGATTLRYSSGTKASAKASIGVTNGKWYWEAMPHGTIGSQYLGIQTDVTFNSGTGLSQDYTMAINTTGRYYSHSGSLSESSAGQFTNLTTSNVIGVALDLDSSTQTIKYYKDGSVILSLNLTDDMQGETIFPFIQNYESRSFNLNFGGYTINTISSAASDDNDYGTFEYAPPSGYYALCSKNLAEYG